MKRCNQGMHVKTAVKIICTDVCNNPLLGLNTRLNPAQLKWYRTSYNQLGKELDMSDIKTGDTVKLKRKSRDFEEVLRRGRAAWKRIKNHAVWNDWLELGETLLEARNEAMRAAGTNQPAG